MMNVRNAATFWLLCVGAAWMQGCASSATHVNGPDGEPGWVSISCKRNQANCYERAGDECPHGYVVATEGGGNNAFATINATQNTAFGMGMSVYSGHLLIKCKRAGDSSDPPERDEDHSPAPTSGSTPRASSAPTCAQIYTQIEAMAGVWAEWFGGEPLAEDPPSKEFVNVCVDLPQQVKRCLYADFARTRRTQCISIVRSLPHETRHEIDSMLVKRVITEKLVE